MLSLSKKVEYGLIALLHLDASGSDSVVSSKELAERSSLSIDLMGKVMQSLARAGLITAEHGARGGYRLSRPLSAMTLGLVVEAIEGPTHLVPCQHDADQCIQFSSCIVKKPMQEIHTRLKGFMHGINLGELQRPIPHARAGQG